MKTCETCQYHGASAPGVATTRRRFDFGTTKGRVETSVCAECAAEIDKAAAESRASA